MDRDINEILSWIERETFLHTKLSRMLSKGDQALILQMFSLMVHPKAILELGTFTGYSTVCLSRGLDKNGIIDTLEINDELEDLIREGLSKGGLTDRVNLHIGDALEIIPTLNRMYDLVYIDADKREYCNYYKALFDKVSLGGYIIADNVLWDGKVLLKEPPKDAQTQSIIAFNEMVKNDSRVENVILPIRDGLSIIYKTSMS